MIVVTGTAPRCGTSAMMRLLLQSFEAHSLAEAFPEYVAREKNPDGFWDMKKEALFSSEKIPYEENKVIKLWSPQFSRVDASKVKLVVLMTRDDFEAQVASIYNCAIAEGFAPPTGEVISGMFQAQKEGIKSNFSNTQLLRVRMEDLREYPDQILSHIKEIV